MSKVNTVEPNNNNLNINRISNGTVIIGTIETNGDIRIDGKVEGNITSGGRVIIGDTGSVKGDLTAKTLDIMGCFEGNIIVADTTTLKSTAVVSGSMVPGKLVVESGAKFNGTCDMGKTLTQTATDPKKAEIKPQQAAS